MEELREYRRRFDMIHDNFMNFYVLNFIHQMTFIIKTFLFWSYRCQFLIYRFQRFVQNAHHMIGRYLKTEEILKPGMDFIRFNIIDSFYNA